MDLYVLFSEGYATFLWRKSSTSFCDARKSENIFAFDALSVVWTVEEVFSCCAYTGQMFVDVIASQSVRVHILFAVIFIDFFKNILIIIVYFFKSQYVKHVLCVWWSEYPDICVNFSFVFEKMYHLTWCTVNHFSKRVYTLMDISLYDFRKRWYSIFELSIYSTEKILLLVWYCTLYFHISVSFFSSILLSLTFGNWNLRARGSFHSHCGKIKTLFGVFLWV